MCNFVLIDNRLKGKAVVKHETIERAGHIDTLYGLNSHLKVFPLSAL